MFARTHNPVTLTFHEWGDMLRDAARPQSLRSRLGQLFGPPERAHSQRAVARTELDHA